MKTRAVQAPQRSNGKLRVAAIMEAADVVIGEKGYEAATMAEIAERSGTKIGSLYRFFPNKESVGETMLAQARERLDAEFGQLEGRLAGLSTEALVDELQALLFERLITPSLKKLLDSNEKWSAKREEFRLVVLERVARVLAAYSPKLGKKGGADVALVLMLTMKAVASYGEYFGPDATTRREFREMMRLYLESRLASRKG